MNLTAIVLILLGLALLALLLWRLSDHLADRKEAARLRSLQPRVPSRFDPAMVDTLPAPVRRYFLSTILPGTPLCTVAHITMSGKFGMGNKANPGYMEMRAWQILASPEGFIWKMKASRGALRLSGSDAGGWTRFWMMGLIPVAHLGGTPDHARAAFGRYVAETVFWAPAALLPGPGVSWEALDASTARVVVRHRGMEQSVDISLADDGLPERVCFPRWSNANPQKVYRLQNFGGYLSRYRDFGGFMLPTHVEAGNFFDTPDYFPFFMADVEQIVFPENEEGHQQ